MKIFHVDAFTSRPFQGNPAGVCPLSHPKVDTWMQDVAAEMNLSETAFIIQKGAGYDLRWFTPKVEVDLCGHGTLASAHILWEEGFARHDDPITFHTRSGILTAWKDGEWIGLDFPLIKTERIGEPDGLGEALGVPLKFVGSCGDDYIVEVDSETRVRGLDPDIAFLGRLPVRGIIVTAPAETTGYDFVSRFFAPAVGVDEDPVTGSAHCCLAPYWAGRMGKDDLTGYQASRRGGVVKVRCVGDRVHIFGQAVTVLKGEIIV